MSTPDRLPDEAIDGLLDGSPSEEAVGTPLAAYLAAIRHDARTTSAHPTEALQVVLAEGLDPAHLGTAGATTASASGDSRPGILGWRLRSRALSRVLVTKVAALGLLGKAAVAGAAVTVAASSAGAAGVLPAPAQHAFDDAVGREVSQAPVDPGTDQEETSSTSGDTSRTPPLETDVPRDATGGSDGEPGVDGRDVAEDASDERSKAAEKAAERGRAPQDTPAGPERGEDAVRDTPAENAPGEAPAEQAPDRAPDQVPAEDADPRESPDRDTEPAPADQGDVGQRSDTDRGPQGDTDSSR